MAERIDWNIYANRVNGQSPFTVGRVDFVNVYERGADLLSNVGKHPFVNRIRTIPVPPIPKAATVAEFAKKSAREWWDNVDPRKMKDKSTAWRIGYGLGVVESAAFVLLLPGSGLIKGAANFGLTQAAFFATNGVHEAQRRWIENRYSGQEQIDRLDKLANDKTTWDAIVKDVTKGVAAGGAYASPILGVGTEVFSAIKLPTINMPNISMPKAPDLRIPGSAPKPDKVTAPAKPTEAPKPTVAAPTVVATATQAPVTAPTEIPRPAAAPATPVAEPVAATKPNIVIPRPGPAIAPAPVDPAPGIKAPPIVEAPAAPKAVPPVEVNKAPATFQEKLAKFLSENKNDPSMVTDHLVASGETAGHLLVQADAPVRWDGTDWQGFAALWAMNPESFKDIQSAMGLSDKEFAELVTRMSNNDKAAYDKLVKHMSLLRAGSTVKVLSAAGMRKFLGN